jgi:hypothetical protein
MRGELEMRDIKAATMAGYVLGRGGFGKDGPRWYLYLFTLDHDLAVATMDLWGGRITERRTRDGQPQYKYIADASDVPEILEEIFPCLMGEKRERAADSLADRIILDETIQASLDAFLGDVGFIEEWNRVRNALADAVQSDDERAALEDLAAVEGLESYIGAAETLLEGDLSGIEAGAGAQFTVSVETARHTVAAYERALEAGTVDDDAPTVRQAEDVLEEETADEIVPQEIPEAVRRDTEARRAAMASG